MTESKEKFELRKQLKVLREIRGSGTELISLYLTPGYPIAEVSSRLKAEYGQASNIKSKTTRKNVQDALEKIIHYLKSFHEVPPNGMAVFCGNISRDIGKSDIRLFSIIPPEPLRTQFYRCDSSFALEPLEEILAIKDTYGLLVMDGREATIATLRGKNTNILRRLHSTAHAKVRKGGQCLSPDTLVHLGDGSIREVSKLAAGTPVKGLDTRRCKIGDFVCSDIFKTKSRRYHRIRTHSPIYEIKATPFHRFLVLTEYGVKEKYAKDLVPGDRVLAARRIDHTGGPVPTGLKAEAKIVLDKNECGRLRARRRELGLSQKTVAEQLGICRMSLCRMERGEGSLSKAKVLALYSLLGLELDPKYIRKMVKLPEFFTPDFAYLLGVICGDGLLDGNRIMLYARSEELARKYCAAINKVFGLKTSPRVVDKVGQKGSFAKKHHYEVRIYSKEVTGALSTLFPELFVESANRDIPEQILRCGPDVTAGFLKGLYDAEGCIRSGRADIACRSERLMRKVQMLLLRFGVHSSFSEKKVVGKRQWVVTITDKESLRNFRERIGFRRSDKEADVRHICSIATKMGLSNQIAIDDREAYRSVREAGPRASNFHAASCFFRNMGPLGRKAAADKRWVCDFPWDIYDWDVVPVNVASNELIEQEGEFYDLTVPVAENFVANGLIVHNSARRYERQIEESIEYYYKRIGEALDEVFLGMPNFKGIIIGGPGPAKDDFVKMRPFNYQIKVLGVLDTGYTEEYGVKELMDKASQVIAEQEAVKEKRLVDGFMREVVSQGLATYGVREVEEALRAGKVELLLLSEGLALKRITYKCSFCGKTEERLEREAAEHPHGDGGKMKPVGETDLVEELLKLAEEKKVKVEVISTDTSEGAQFLSSFFGIGALLRYK